MEHTKGKFEAMPYTRRDGDNIRWVKAVKGKKQAICQTFKPNAEANAKELIRRWNAFEKDGLVDELRAALKALMAAPETLPPDNEFDKEQRDYRNRCMTRIDEARKLGKAAIAKVT